MNQNPRHRRTLFAALALPIFFTGCSVTPGASTPSVPEQAAASAGTSSATAAPGSSDVPPPPSEAQLAALKDGDVSQVEYQSAYERFARCAKDSGYTVEFVGVSNDVIEYRMTEEASRAVAVQNCYAVEFQKLDMAWQLAHEDTSEGAAQAEKCLRQWGMRVPEKYADRVKLLEGAGIDLATCLKS